MMRKVLLTIGIVVLVVVAGGTVFVASRQHLRFDATPYPNVTASTDSAVIERGRYIVRDAAPCAACHGDPAQREAYKTGADVPLSGGFVFAIPPGEFYTRNLTPDVETGPGSTAPLQCVRQGREGNGAGEAHRSIRGAAHAFATRCVAGDRALPRRISGALLGVSHRAQSDDRCDHGAKVRRDYRLHRDRRSDTLVVAAEHNE